MANQRDFNDFVDTIIAEAAGEGRKGMIAVASVINNRATVRGQSVGQVVRASNQFDGYSNPGSAAKKAQQNAKMRAEAEKIARDVLAGKIEDPTGGADHFYSGANKPGWANKLAKTVDIGGHKFHQSPQAASKLGNALRATGNVIGDVANAVTAPVRQAAVGAGNIASALRTAAFPSMSPPPRPSAPVGNNPLGSYSRANLTPGISNALDVLSYAPQAANIGINSGYRSPTTNAKAGGASRSQHLHGNAVDIDISRLSPADRTALLDLAIEKGNVKGVGVYPSGNSLHIDTRANPTAWGPSPRGKYSGLSPKELDQLPEWAQASIKGMYQAGSFPVTPRTTAPTPTARPSAPSSMMAAPLGKVERAPLQAASPRTPDPERFGRGLGLVSSAQAATMPNRPSPSMDTMLGRGTVTAPSFTSARMTAPATSLPAQRMTAPAQPAVQPSAAKQAQAYREYAASRPSPNQTLADIIDGTQTAGGLRAMMMGTPDPRAPGVSGSMNRVRPSVQPTGSMNNAPRGNLQPPAPNANMSLAAQYASYGAGRPVNAPAAAAMVSPNVGPLTQTSLLPPKATIPNFVPATPPPPPMPVQQVRAAPRQQFPSAPPAQPQYTAADVYAGRANSGVATGGNTVSRDQYGNTSVTNKYGVTTTTNANGQQMASSGPGIGGPLGSGGIGSVFDAQPDLNGRSKFGNTARQVGAGMAGSVVGGLLGPIGSLLGAALAGELAKPGAGRVGDLINGVRTMNINGQPMQFARPQSGGAFPNAPSGGFRDPTFSNRSDREMRDISPKAARDIKSGTAGLF